MRAGTAARAVRLLAFVALFIGYTPIEARGPLSGEPHVAGVRLFYGPRVNLQDVDRTLIGSARESIDIAAYILTDRSVMDALAAAARRGVKVRLFLDPDLPGGRPGPSLAALQALARTPGLEARIKTGDELMHLKAYQVDGRALRTGSANFSVSGGSRQENDIVVIESRDVAGAFRREFDYLWTRPDTARYRPDAEVGRTPSPDAGRAKGRM